MEVPLPIMLLSTIILTGTVLLHRHMHDHRPYSRMEHFALGSFQLLVQYFLYTATCDFSRGMVPMVSGAEPICSMVGIVMTALNVITYFSPNSSRGHDAVAGHVARTLGSLSCFVLPAAKARVEAYLRLPLDRIVETYLCQALLTLQGCALLYSAVFAAPPPRSALRDFGQGTM